MTDKKVILSVILAATMALTSCGDKNNEPSNPGGNTGTGTENPGTPGGDDNGGGSGDANTKTVWVMTTTNTKSFDLTESTITAQPGQSMATKTMKLNPGDQFQEIDGFGSAITESAAKNLLKMNQTDRTKFLQQTFSENGGYGYSYIRVPIGCSDFSETEYTLNDKEGIENFGLTKIETEYLIPVIKEILAINPNVKVMGSPWTAPRWMKVDNLDNMAPTSSWRNGHLNPKYYEDYGTYFVKWIQAFEGYGIPIYAVTPQNEPLNPNNSAGMLMYWDEERDFIKTGLGPKITEAGLGTKIYCFDHNYNYDNMGDQYQYPLKIYQDPEAAKYIAGAAYHNYGGNVSELANIHKANPSKELVFTESTDGTWTPGDVTENVQLHLMNHMENISLGTTNNWSRGVILWNLMLDENHGPFSPADGSCKTGYGTVDLLNNGTIRKNAFYYVLAHMSSVAKPGAYRIGTTGAQNNVISSAFVNPDGTYGLVLLNKNADEVNFTVADGEYKFAVTLPGNSVTSLRW
ncbi:MAG: glucosylceramidase [Muribaculaceae bacterium]|nr:glucosylceramidase [Muribaculaceae bacterium]